MQDTYDYMLKKNISSLVNSVKNIANPLNLINNFLKTHSPWCTITALKLTKCKFRAYGLFGYSRNTQALTKLQEYTRAREIATHEGGNTCVHMGGNFQGCSHAVNCYFKAPPPPDFYIPPVIGPSTCKQTNRGTQRQFPSKYVENTF